MNTTTPFVFGLTAGATAVFLSCDCEVSRMEARQIRKENTATIDKVGLASQLLYENSDLMQRFSHYTDGHQKKVMMCPECSVGETSLLGDEEFSAGEDTRPDQSLLQDASEITRSIERMCSSLLIQQDTLTHTLQSLRQQGNAE